MRSTYIIIILMVAAFICSGQSRKKHKQMAPADKPLVPIAAEQKFAVENPEATAKWKKDGEFYKALFVNPVNNLGYVIVYDKDGRVIRREKELEIQEYPATIREFHERKYPGEGAAIWSSTDSTGNTLFYSQKNNVTLWFDKNGAPLNGSTDSLSPTVR